MFENRWQLTFLPHCAGQCMRRYDTGEDDKTRFFSRVAYRICRRKGRSIFGIENIKKLGCGLCGERVKKKKIKSKPAWICTYGTTNGTITIPLWYRTFQHILPTILSCIVDMKTKIFSLFEMSKLGCGLCGAACSLIAGKYGRIVLTFCCCFIALMFIMKYCLSHL